jgi:hypothetical protein
MLIIILIGKKFVSVDIDFKVRIKISQTWEQLYNFARDSLQCFDVIYNIIIREVERSYTYS